MEVSNGSGQDMASNVARAIAAALDWSSIPDTRKAAVSYLESIKGGDVRVLANTSFQLVKRDWSSEIRLHAFKMLQHLVRLRWEELSPAERRNFANLAVDLMSEIADPFEEWALKSQTAALVAEIVRREDISLWKEMLPSLVSLSSKGPVQAELVSMMLRWLPEDITVHNEDLEGDRRRTLLFGLTQSLPEILLLLYTLLERHYGAALDEVGQQQLDIAKQHAATVTATLNAVNAYAEWAPLPDLAKSGIIHGCGFLLSSPDFRLHACEFFKLVSPRKRPADISVSDFDAAVMNILHILLTVSREFFQRSSMTSGVIGESDLEFAECICESLVSLGSSNLQCISGDSNLLSLYLQQILGYFQHAKLALHYEAFLFWLALMRDLTSKLKAPVHSAGDGPAISNVDSNSGQATNEKIQIQSFLSDDICTVILDVSFQHLLKKEKLPGATLSAGTVELWSDDFEGKGDFGQYRSRLMELIKFIGLVKPTVAGSKVAERVATIINNLLNSQVPAQDLAVFESVQVALENIVSAIYDGSNEFDELSMEARHALIGIFQGLLQKLLSLEWSEPPLVGVLGQYLSAMGPFLKHFPDGVGSVINKLFELLNSLPLVLKDPATSSARYARLDICASFIHIAKSADRSILPHMKAIADSMAHLQREGRLLRGEHNLLGEAFLVMASSAGVQQQHDVLVWLLEPLSQQWMQNEWQNKYLSEPLGLISLCTDTQFMWSIFHTVTFFERALKRSGSKKGGWNSLSNSTETVPMHPIASHLSWMLPPLLKLLRALHSLWSPPVLQMLPEEIKSAMTMSDAEQSSVIGGGNPKLSKVALTLSDGQQIDMSREGYRETNESDIRIWLKGTRDTGYNLLGLATTVGDPFFKSLDSESIAVALMENIQSMEFRHMRQLTHSIIINLVKSCPPEMWEDYLGKLLYPLLSHGQQVLSCSWSSLLHEGRAKVPDRHGILAQADLKVEVLEEKLLRDLTREICGLLSTLASPGLNTGLPKIEHSGHAGRVDVSSLKNLNTFSSSSMVGFLLSNKDLAVPALKISLEALTWTDGNAAVKVAAFLVPVVVLAILSDSVELREFISRDLFSALIRGLALESNAAASSDLVNLCRKIFMYLCDRDPAPRQILLSLPCIRPNDLHAFEEAFSKTASLKEQKQLMKSLLLLATGNNLKALAPQKTANVITNVSAKPRSAVGAQETNINEGEVVGLEAIL